MNKTTILEFDLGDEIVHLPISNILYSIYNVARSELNIYFQIAEPLIMKMEQEEYEAYKALLPHVTQVENNA